MLYLLYYAYCRIYIINSRVLEVFFCRVVHRVFLEVFEIAEGVSVNPINPKPSTVWGVNSLQSCSRGGALAVWVYVGSCQN